jgi:hypothetical protein
MAVVYQGKGRWININVVLANAGTTLMSYAPPSIAHGRLNMPCKSAPKHNDKAIEKAI